MKQDNKSNGRSDQKKKITKDMNLADIIFRYPDAAEIFTDYGLHCVGCIASGFDTIEMGAQVHQLTPEEIEEMVERVNEVVESGE